MSPTIPIIILNWNGIEDTLECGESLMKQSHPDFIVYLVDNGSDERNVRLLCEHFNHHPKIRLIFNEKNLGFTRGNNAVLRSILTEKTPPKYVALLNNDTAVEPDWLSQLVRCAEASGAGMVSSKMVNYYDRSRMDNAKPIQS